MNGVADATRGARSLRLLAGFLGRGDVGDVARASVAPRDWAGIVEMASWHGLQPALHHALTGRGMLSCVPDAERAALGIAAVVATLRADARRRQLGEMLAAFRDAGIPVIALKGAYLAEHAHVDASLRLMSDLDLLVRAPDVGRATDAAFALGYEPSTIDAPARHGPPLVRRGQLPVELHHTIEPCAPPFAMPLADVWARAVPTTIADTPALALAPEDLLLHLATHLAHSHVFGTSLASVHDILVWTIRYGERVDWDVLVRRAREARVHGFAYAAFVLARRVFGAEIPRAPLAALRDTAVDDTMVEHAIALLAAPPFVLVGAKALTDPRDDLTSRARRVARALFLSPALHRLGPRLSGGAGRGPARWVRRDGYIARWTALLALLAMPTVGWSAARQVARVRALRQWAAR